MKNQQRKKQTYKTTEHQTKKHFRKVAHPNMVSYIKLTQWIKVKSRSILEMAYRLRKQVIEGKKTSKQILPFTN